MFQLPRLSRVATRTSHLEPAWTLHLARIAFAALMALALLGPWMTVYNAGVQTEIRQAGYAVILVLALIALRPWQRPERLLVVPWPILLALAWCWLTAFWMIDPAVGIRRLVLTTVVAWSLFALVRQLGAEQTIKIVQIALAITLAVNFVVAIGFPEIGRHPVGDAELTGNWRGLMGHKNFAGVPCAAAVLFFVFAADRVHWIVRALVCTGAIIFLVMSASKTSLGVGAAALGAGLIFQLLAKQYGQQRLAPPAVAWALLIIPAWIFVSMAFDNGPYLEMVSDPTGFTGRTQIWTALIKAYAEHPLLGIGYGSFWDLGPSGPIHQYASNWIVRESEGHNSYLDLLVQIGCIGTLIVLFAVAVWPTQRLLYGGDHPARSLGAGIIVFALGHSFTESQLFDRDSLVQVFVIIAIALLWSVTAAPVEGARTAAPKRGEKPERPIAPLRL
jgi:exopolysaccharide production protein ExoQ